MCFFFFPYYCDFLSAAATFMNSKFNFSWWCQHYFFLFFIGTEESLSQQQPASFSILLILFVYSFYQASILVSSWLLNLFSETYILVLYRFSFTGDVQGFRKKKKEIKNAWPIRVRYLNSWRSSFRIMIFRVYWCPWRENYIGWKSYVKIVVFRRFRIDTELGESLK